MKTENADVLLETVYWWKDDKNLGWHKKCSHGAINPAGTGSLIAFSSLLSRLETFFYEIFFALYFKNFQEIVVYRWTLT